MSRRAIKAINWTAIAERIHESDRPMYAAFKAKNDQFMRNLQAYPETAPKIDWAYYQKTVPVSGMVEKFQKEYESLSIPYPADNYTAKIDALEKQLEPEIQKFIDESNERIKSHEKELERLRKIPPIGEMTMEDFKDYYPELALDQINRPTIWPNDPRDQPWEHPEEEKKSGH